MAADNEASAAEPFLNGRVHRSDDAGREEEVMIKQKSSLLWAAASDAENFPSCMIKETSYFKERWDMVIVVCILYSAIIVPFRLCFRAEATGNVWVLEACMSLVFLSDLVLTFNTAYLQDGNWVVERPKIARRYLTSWFIIDAPSSLPVELIEHMLPEAGNASTLAAFRVLRMLRLVRMLRLLKLGHFMARFEEEWEISLRPIRVVELVVQMLFFAHMLACGWFLTTWINPEAEADIELTWVETYDGGSAVDGPISRQYYLSFWWAVTTLFAINPIKPATDTERTFLIFVNVLNRLLLAYLIGKISTLIAQLDRHSALVQDKLDVVKEYLFWRKTPKELSIKVKRYYEFYYQRQAVFDEHSILNALSPQLKSALVRSNCKDTLGRIPLFSKLSPDFLAHVFPLVKPLSFQRGVAIYSQGEVAKELIFLLDGQVDMMSEFDPSTPARRVLCSSEILLSSDGDDLVAVDGCGCFGQEVLVGMRRRCTAIAHTTVETLIIEKGALLSIFRNGDFAVDLRRICGVVLESFMARERLRNFKTKFRRATLRNLAKQAAGSITERTQHAQASNAAALTLILCWRRYCDRKAARDDELSKLFQFETMKLRSSAVRSLTGGRTPSSLTPSGWRGGGEPEGAPPRLANSAPPTLESLAMQLQRIEQKQDALADELASRSKATKAKR